jgi:hypothetical protein
VSKKTNIKWMRKIKVLNIVPTPFLQTGDAI